MKKTLSAIFLALAIVSNAFSLSIADDQKDLSAIADGFAVAMSKKDKAWMEANFNNDCITYSPSGEQLNKQATIYAFSGGVYNISKSSANNKTFKVTDNDAGGSADYTVEGDMSGNDISGTYKLSFKFKRTDTGWKVSEILIHGQ
ncbi:nuclear transport factor 2 family protein [Daejeonella lutea]|uniref:DUF4440 domain-containing protein n=1 Tax=Daejeonella lutea TaxID=572036 RepID=A0A1T5DA88_9SPHI|nr:nuclear transport factor 2 family protein [Daejeonella lutea]SKB68410.1 protein of unknown function [Daejeonella lutea]